MAENKSKVPIGTVLDGKFRVTREIGRGGMAAVYEAQNIDIGKRVAVKILAAELIQSRVVRERFLREARAAAAVRSPYICDVYDVGMYDERPFLVMELLEGESLYDLLSRVRRLDVRTTLTIATHTARGLAKAHESNVVHRDLKPENIFLTRDEEGLLVAKILDFGLAKFYEPANDRETVRLTREGALFGTPAYMSPEQAKGDGEADHRSDLWALGCIVYECLTGLTVWNVEQGVAMILAQIAGAPLPRPSRLRPNLPPAFDEWFTRCLMRDRERRFQTAKELANALALSLVPGAGVASPGSAAAGQNDGRVIDDLIENLRHELPANPGLSDTQGSALRPAPVEVLSGDRTEIEAAHERDGARAIAVLLILSVVAVGAYALWLYWLHPARRLVATADAGIATANKTPGPVEREPFALPIAAAQESLRSGDAKRAVSLFHEAFKMGSSAVARSLMSHADVIIDENARDGSHCRVNGLGRPRPFDTSQASSRPSLALGVEGVVVAWADNHLDEKRQQGFASLLDASLRRISQARAVTPEAESITLSQLKTAGEKLAVVYWESAGKEPGVYVRMLESDGRIGSPALRISAIQKHSFYPALARAEDGSFWAVWEEETGPGVTDIVTRHLGPNLKPLQEAARLTAFLRRSTLDAVAGQPDVAIAHGFLYVVLSIQRSATTSQIMLLRAKLSDPALQTGIGAGAESGPRKGKSAPRKREDRVVGTLKPMSNAYSKTSQPTIVCVGEGCFAVWDDATAGAAAAFIDKDTGEPLWHREFAAEGFSPALAASTSGAAVVWYEKSRLRLASVTRDGLGPASTLTRASGRHPYPAMVPGTQPGEWYISWRDYESAHFESFVLRVQCR